ncbi:putative RNA helicase [Mycena floridula]|nr:putative RNA helicase [Mycena floridula]
MSKPGQRQDLSQYNYGNISSLVLMADKSVLPRRDKEPDGAPTSLAGRIDVKDMGTRVIRGKAATEKEKKKEKERESKPKKAPVGYHDILTSTADVEGLIYTPRSSDTRDVYQLIIASVHTHLGDQPHDIVRSAADAILESLKNESLKDFDKKKEIEDVLGVVINGESFSTLVALSKKITDYGADDVKMADPDGDGQAIDDEHGVAVVFNDDEEDESDDENQGLVVSDDSDAEGEEENDSNAGDVADGDETLQIGQTGSKSSAADSDTIAPHSVDAFWVQRHLSEVYPDPVTASTKAAKVLELLASASSPGAGDTSITLRDVENSLMDLFEYAHFDLVKTLLKNRDVIVWATKYNRSTEEERVDLEVAMREKGLAWILRELKGERGVVPANDDRMDVDQPAKATGSTSGPTSGVKPKKTLDLPSLAFASSAGGLSGAGYLMTNKKVKLPDGSFKRSRKGWEEVHVPPPAKKEMEASESLVPIASLPSWAQKAFKSTQNLNRIQSKVFPTAFNTDENMLICAPTGAGKTNVAMLTVLHELSKHISESGELDTTAFKIVYIAPMKALVQEMVGNFSSRLSSSNSAFPHPITVGELTGDAQMTKSQITDTQIIVTTPEKWDVITRKGYEGSYTRLVRLIIIDEIHLLHDERGPVLEAIVARTLRNAARTGEHVRLIGLSATLPNYEDVATFLRVDPTQGLFYFDASYRPCGLRMQFAGVTEKKAIKRYQVQNQICYEKVLDQAGIHQTLVFVHSRKETGRTAKFLRDTAVDKEDIGRFVKPDGATREILVTEAKNVRDPVLKDLLPFGFAIHHAGMSREDRGLVEDLFGDGVIQVLVCTATLAWGVNLPAHTVIIKGTSIYHPESGGFVPLSSQDTLQMLGRAGRPQFDTEGEGIVITTAADLQFYLSLGGAQLPIESRMMGGKIVDTINAEVVAGAIRNIQDGVEWVGWSYLYVRMLKAPGLYNVGQDYITPDDPTLMQKRADVVHSAAVLLEKAGLVKYDRTSGALTGTELGKIASYYYITYNSMLTYIKNLRSGMGTIELCRVFAMSEEFRWLPVRAEEKLELAKLLERVPIPVKEGVEEPAAKINVLLQAWISGLKLDGFVLMADMVFVTQSAGRILRAMFEICLRKGWAVPAKAALDMCKMVEKRMWGSMTPLRQFKGVPAEVIRKAEGKQFPWYRYFDLSPPEIGELIGLANAGRLVHRLVHSFPKLQLQAQVQPITRSLLRIDLSIVPDFRWDEKIHSSAETFLITVEDVDGEVILFHDSFVLRQRYAEQEHNVTLTVPMFDSPVPPNYYISIVSDRWLHSETRLPISFKHLLLPEKYPPPTPLLELQALPLSALHNKEFERLYEESIQTFNKIQTQVFQALYTTDDNVFIGAPTGSGKTVCAEFALLRLWSKKGDQQRAVCIEPFQEMVEMRVQEWQTKFKHLGKEILSLTGETSSDLRTLEKADVVVCTPTQWDVLSRRWRQRKNVQNIGLLIADEVQQVGGEVGPTYEVVISRTRYVSAQTELKTRIVACGVSLANARDLGEWMGVPSHAIFNFSPSARPLDLDIHLHSFSIPHFPSLMIAMSKPAYLAIAEHSPTKPVIIFVPSRKQCRLTVDDLLTHCTADDQADRFLNIELSDLEIHLEHISDAGLKETLKRGVAYYHEALNKQDKRIVQRLFESGAVQVLVASKDTAWSLPVSSYMVIIMGVQYFEGKEHRYIDYPVMDVLQMMGRACRPRDDDRSRCVLMCQQTRKDFYKKFLSEGLPIESHLANMLHDYFLAEIAVKTIENKQDAMDILTWTYFYRRMTQNPNYYNLHNVSHQHLSDHLSELVETTLSDLVGSKCIAIEDEMDVSALNLGMIAAYYNISYVTVDVYTLSLKERTKLKGLLEVIASSAEFETIPIRRHEDSLLKRLYDRLPVKLDPTSVDYEAPHFKTFLLLQAHFSRINLPADLAADQAVVLSKVLNLLSACVDVMSSNAWLSALGAMDLAQMCVQAVWERDSPLKQIPHFEPDVVDRCKEAGVESVYDVMEMEDAQRNDLLKMTPAQMHDVAAFVNSYPTLEVDHQLVKGEYTAGSPIFIKVTLSREEDEDSEASSAQDVIAPFYPAAKIANWWVVVGEAATKQLCVIKKVTVGKTALDVKLEFTLPKGKHDLKLYVICDSYVGADHDIAIGTVDVAEGEDSDDDDDDSGDEMQE